MLCQQWNMNPIISYVKNSDIFCHQNKWGCLLIAKCRIKPMNRMTLMHIQSIFSLWHYWWLIIKKCNYRIVFQHNKNKTFVQLQKFLEVKYNVFYLQSIAYKYEFEEIWVGILFEILIIFWYRFYFSCSYKEYIPLGIMLDLTLKFIDSSNIRK